MATNDVKASAWRTAECHELKKVSDTICRDAAKEIADIADMLRGKTDEAGELEHLLRGAVLRVAALAEAITFGLRSEITRKDVAESYLAVYGEKLVTLLGEPVEVAHG